MSIQVDQGCADEWNERNIGIVFVLEGKFRKRRYGVPKQGYSGYRKQNETTVACRCGALGKPGHGRQWTDNPIGMKDLGTIVAIFGIQPVKSFDAIEDDAQNVLLADEIDSLVNRVAGCRIGPDYQQTCIRALSQG